ncbi:MAG: hypothetical protein IJD11_01655 [Oscillospiraceae bacterium]|nr:hypothetical protein [Oscillospiraceae bacterium]
MKVKNFAKSARRLCYLVLALALICTSISVSAAQEQTPASADYTPLSIDNEYYALSVSDEDGRVTLTDKKTGKQFHSYPDGTEDDESMKRAGRLQVRSALHVELFDRANEAKGFFYSISDSVNMDGMKVRRLEKEIVVDYSFPDAQVTIPVHYTLDKDRLVVSILPDELVEEADWELMNVSVHPYFFCGTSAEEGYLLVPDGSGALIDFNNKKYTATPYKQKVYGIDLSGFRYSDVEYSYDVLMPVFGIGKADSMAIGVITAGAGDAYVEANPGITNISYNGAYATFNLMGQDLRSYSDDNRTDMDVFPDKRNGLKLIQVTYMVQDGGETDYADMAKLYQSYLVEAYDLTRITDNSYPLYLDIYNATMRKKSFLGIPYLGVETLTTFAEAEEMVKALQGANIPVTVRLNNWSDQTVRGKALTGESLLGSKESLLSLKATVEKSGSLYLNGNISEIYEPGLFGRFYMLAENMRNAIIDYQEFDLATNLLLDTSHFLLKADKILPYTVKFGDAVKGLGFNTIGVEGLNNMYTDYSIDGASMTLTSNAYEESIRQLSENGMKVVVDGGVQYALGQTALIMDMPSGDSMYEACDRAVPFFSIALHGYVPFALESVNSSAEPHKALLKTLETGSGLSFEWIGAEANKVLYSRNADLYHAEWKNWIEMAKTTYAEYAAFMKGKQSLTIKDHSYLTPDVSRTVYEDGSFVVVNYGNTVYTADGVTVEPLSYITGKEAA